MTPFFLLLSGALGLAAVELDDRDVSVLLAFWSGWFLNMAFRTPFSEPDTPLGIVVKRPGMGAVEAFHDTARRN